LEAVYRGLVAAGLATANAGLITDIIACPGLDYCALANARSIPVAQEISTRFGSPERQAEIGELKIKISGCINACGHHHVGHIGILGVEKNGKEFYQITLGGRADEHAQLGTLLGPAVSYEQVPGLIEDVVDTYLELRAGPQELFIDTVARLGVEPFKERVYASH
ncbi:MAG: nitrite/sulfite reductase, partial [Starkeya sp.]|nr:nitrite/sulfite reductase [Starkeya sp.]